MTEKRASRGDLEAELRERIAQEIEAEHARARWGKVIANDAALYRMGVNDSFRAAARVARGSSAATDTPTEPNDE